MATNLAMTSSPTISKTQYLKGLQCPLALWYYRYRKDLKPEIDPATQMRFDVGKEVGILAQKYFVNGIEITENYREIKKAVQSTQQLTTEGHEIIYEAIALHPINGSYSRIDILRKIPNKEIWDLIEVKSSTETKDYHFDDVSFQYYVFDSAGYKINNCYLMLINNEYVRQGGIDPLSLFKLENISEEILSRQSSINQTTTQLCQVIDQNIEPDIEIGSQCFTPFECEYRYHCWRCAPVFSIYNVYTVKRADAIFSQTRSYDLKDVPSDMLPKGLKAIDVACYKKNTDHLEKENIKNFLNALKYPLYFLDYETLMSAIPLYEGTRPYQQIPFQFSLYVQTAPGGELRHFEFLHKEPTDPRPVFIEKLLELCGTNGSVVVYNQSFEINRNKELANDFPGFSTKIEAINNRIVDLMMPFSKRWIYNPEQLGSHSIKKVLPAYVPELSYSDMEITSGVDAMTGYLKFVKGTLSQEEIDALWPSLYKYCEMDTYAMVRLLEVLITLAA